MPIFLLGAAINFAVMAVLFTWPPNPDQGYVFFVMAGLWGVADAVWQTQINGNMLKKNVFNCFWIIFVFSCLYEALYGSLFEGKEEAGFSNYRMWESIGFMIAYMLQNNVRKTMRIWRVLWNQMDSPFFQFCIDFKLWFLVVFLVVGMGGYLVVEARETRRKKGEGASAWKKDFGIPVIAHLYLLTYLKTILNYTHTVRTYKTLSRLQNSLKTPAVWSNW